MVATMVSKRVEGPFADYTSPSIAFEASVYTIKAPCVTSSAAFCNCLCVMLPCLAPPLPSRLQRLLGQEEALE